MDTLYVNNDHILEISRLQDSDGALVTGAQAEGTLYESDGITEVSGVTWPLTLVYVPSDTVYRGELPAGLGLVAGRRYKLKLSAVSVGKRFEVTRNVRAEVRYS